MNLVMFFIGIYLIGAIITFGRCYADDGDAGLAFGVSILSWLCLPIALFIWFAESREDGTPFLKFKPEPVKQLPEFNFTEKIPDNYSWMK